MTHKGGGLETTADTVTITLPLPAKALSPNGRPHHFAKARAVKAYRTLAKAVAGEAVGWVPPRWDAATVSMRFYFASNRKRDRDNLLASMKSAMDGIADAGVVGNDCGFVYPPVETDTDKANPRVVVRITRLIVSSTI